MGIRTDITSVNLFGIRVEEPSATLTDLVVSVVCFYAFFKLRKINRNDLAFTYFNLFFLTMAFATTFGGLLGHAFLYAVDFAWKLPGWITSMFSISLLERASIKHAKKFLHPTLAKTYEIANVIELFVVMGITFYTLDFFFVEFHSGFGLLAVISPIQLYVFWKTKNKGSLLFLIGVGIAIISAIIFMNKITIHAWFDHLALSHLLMAAAAYLFYLASLKVESFDKRGSGF